MTTPQNKKLDELENDLHCKMMSSGQSHFYMTVWSKDYQALIDIARAVDLLRTSENLELLERPANGEPFYILTVKSAQRLQGALRKLTEEPLEFWG